MTNQATPRQIAYATRLALRNGWSAEEIAHFSKMSKSALSENIDVLESTPSAHKIASNLAFLRRFDSRHGTNLATGAC